MNKAINLGDKLLRYNLLLFVLLYSSGNIVAQQFKIHADFPGGNILVHKISNDSVWISPDLRDTKGEWFYWCFAVSNANGKCLKFVLTKPNCLTAKGPSFSLDGGSRWDWINPNASWNTSFSYTFSSDDEVRFSMGMPYTVANFQNFIYPYLKSGSLSIDTLALSKEGRCIERLIIKPVQSNYKVLVTARHHACEMMANYEMEGMIAAILKDRWLKENVEFCFIPFVDKDGVENGDQGKNRVPRDHNRDYSGTSIYSSTAALRNWVPHWSENKLVMTIDLHCPWIKSDNNEHIYVVGSANESISNQQQLFCKMLTSCNNGELKVSDKIFLPYGTAWNRDKNFSEGDSFSKWSGEIPGVKLSISIEFPYSNNEGQTITQENTREFGADFAGAVKEYLKQL